MLQSKPQSNKTCERIHFLTCCDDVATCAVNAATVARDELNGSDKFVVGPTTITPPMVAVAENIIKKAL